VFTIKKTIELLTKGKERFGVKSSPISVDHKADLSLFNPNGSSVFSKELMISRSKNSIFEHTELKGTVYGIIANNQIIVSK
jgi:dihydroorotase